MRKMILVGLLLGVAVLCTSCRTTTTPAASSAPVAANAPHVALNHKEDSRGMRKFRLPKVMDHIFKVAVVDGLDPVAGQPVRVVPKRVTLTDGTILRLDPEHLEDSLAKMSSHLVDEHVFEAGTTDDTGRHEGRFQVDRTIVSEIELVVLDPQGEGTRVMERREQPTFEERLLEDMLTDIDTLDAQRQRSDLLYREMKPENIKVIERKALQADGTFTNIVAKVIIRPPYIPWKVRQHFNRSAAETTKALSTLKKSGSAALAKEAARYLHDLAPKREQRIQ